MSDLPKGGIPAADLDDEIQLDLDTETEIGPDDETEIETDDIELDEDGNPVEPEPKPALAAPAAHRGSPRVQSLVNENRELKARQAQFERQLADLTATRNQPSAAEVAAFQEQERQRFELMSPYEQAQYTRQVISNEVAQQTNQIRNALWEQNDQQIYETMLRETPAYKRFDDQVKELKAQAPGVARKYLLATAIGLRALEGGGAARTRAANAAAAGVARNGARPAGGRGDVPSERGRGGGETARDARLRAAGLIP